MTPAPPDPDDIALSVLLARLAERVADLAELSLEVQDLLARCEMAHPDDGTIRGLQRLDLISQSLEDYAAILAAAAPHLPATLRLPKAALLAVAHRQDSRAIIAGHPPDADPPAEGQFIWL